MQESRKAKDERSKKQDMLLKMRCMIFIALFLALSVCANAQNRWTLQPDGSIRWLVKPGESHTDNIEMSGRFISTILTYGVDEKGKLIIARQLVFPMLRTIPNNTHASLIYTFGPEASPIIKINSRQANEIVTGFSIRGMLTIESTINNNIFVSRKLLPSVNKPLMVEKYTLRNKGDKDISVDIEEFEKNTRTHREKSVYDALISASFLARDLGKPASLVNKYKTMANELKISIEKYFGANVEGFNTYRYYEGNDVLRSWICIPLTVGIFDRAEGTIDALFSPRLWTDQGLLTQAGTTTFWDRSTLYGFRGVFSAGATEQGLKYLTFYSNLRLLGDHVPYAVEAWPEGNQRHLSAESALYCRAITEGMFGFRPAGLNSFSITPQLPSGWNEMALKKLVAFGGQIIDIEVTREDGKIKTMIMLNGKTLSTIKIPPGTSVKVEIPLMSG